MFVCAVLSRTHLFVLSFIFFIFWNFFFFLYSSSSPTMVVGTKENYSLSLARSHAQWQILRSSSCCCTILGTPRMHMIWKRFDSELELNHFDGVSSKLVGLNYAHECDAYALSPAHPFACTFTQTDEHLTSHKYFETIQIWPDRVMSENCVLANSHSFARSFIQFLCYIVYIFILTQIKPTHTLSLALWLFLCFVPSPSFFFSRSLSLSLSWQQIMHSVKGISTLYNISMSMCLVFACICLFWSTVLRLIRAFMPV